MATSVAEATTATYVWIAMPPRLCVRSGLTSVHFCLVTICCCQHKSGELGDSILFNNISYFAVNLSKSKVVLESAPAIVACHSSQRLTAFAEDYFGQEDEALQLSSSAVHSSATLHAARAVRCHVTCHVTCMLKRPWPQ